MTIRKTKLADLEMGYAVAPIQLDGTTHVVAAPETKGPFLLFSPPEWKASLLADGPGGVMSMVQLRGHDSALAAIGECYPVFRFQDAGVYFVRPGEEQPRAEEQRSRPALRNRGSVRERSVRERNELAVRQPSWSATRGFDLPFAHRLETVHIAGQAYLIAATIAAGKSSKEDWGRPGSVYAFPIPDRIDGEWKATPILEGITKNHGMHHASMDGQDVLFIGGTQGLIALTVPSQPEAKWERRTLLSREVSEIYAADLDEDGQLELVTIEPFHGNQLSVYKRSGDSAEGSWHRLFEADLSFGHALWAGTLAGEQVVMAGSRSGDMDLSVFTIESLVPFVAQRQVVEQGAGPTQLLVLHEEQQDLIFSVNQAMSEVAMYTVTE